MNKDTLFRFFINEIDYSQINNPECLNDVEYLDLHTSSPVTYSKLSAILTTYYPKVRSLEISDFEIVDNDDNNSNALITRERKLHYVEFVDLSYSTNVAWKNFHKILGLMPNINSLCIGISNLGIRASDFSGSLAVLCNTQALRTKITCLQLILDFTKVNLSKIFIYFDKLEHLRLHFIKYDYDDDTTTKLQYDENTLDSFCFELMENKTLLSVDIIILK
ncbi:unnamed protein product [Didymodactylos carnosus]|uniref:Uncharacterized protein n=1 Tax=Didymodactylos carnosus TaxID=1234261 RepID=A0A814YL83_9BILA|nr:unnamed protein product [Didymodactylos carnosus]CAF1230668.1 unnamed protein product [Didymodactylos carnosus]CAF3844122.1 unnamed protein product [Didymodactylos carnosus]CAF3993364.1 unnamed protein product [Didymodactylos carnosus]